MSISCITGNQARHMFDKMSVSYYSTTCSSITLCPELPADLLRNPYSVFCEMASPNLRNSSTSEVLVEVAQESALAARKLTYSFM